MSLADRERIRRGNLNDLWIYNEEDDEWQEEVSQNTPPSAREGQKSAAIDGKLYIFSGKSGGVELTDLWRYDPTKQAVGIG